MSKALIEEVRKATKACYRKARDVVYAEDREIELFAKYKALGDGAYEKVEAELRRLLDDEYLVNVRKLPTIKLKKIMYVHSKGEMMRTMRTITAINDELAYRALVKTLR